MNEKNNGECLGEVYRQSPSKSCLCATIALGYKARDQVRSGFFVKFQFPLFVPESFWEGFVGKNLVSQIGTL